MKKQTKWGLLLVIAVLAAGTAIYSLLFAFDNKYTAALPGGYGYNILQGDQKDVAFLVDGWEYYPGQLLEPADFSDGITAEAYTYIGEHANFSDDLGTPYGTATYRLVLYSDPGTHLSLYLPELLCAGQVFLDGALAGSHGSVDPYMPHVIDGLYAFTSDGSTEIVIQCANYTHYYSGMYYPPAVGSSGAVFRLLAMRLAVYGFLCFSSFAIAVINLIPWLTRRDRLPRQMGFLSLAFAVRVSYPFFRALGVPLVSPLYALEDLCGNLVLLCAILMAGELSGAAVRRYHRIIVVPAAAALCVYTTVFPLLILPYTPWFFNIYGISLYVWKLAAGCYLLFLAGRTLREGRPMGKRLLCAAGFYGLSITASVTTVGCFEPIRGAWLEEYGGFALVLGFAALTVRRCVFLARENSRLAFHLQEEVDRKTRGMETLLKERRELLANLLHDLKNPLSALQGYAELVRNGNVALDQETAFYLDALTDRVEVVGERFNLLQDFSRSERGLLNMEDICLNHFLTEFYQFNQPDIELAGQEFRLELPPEEIFVRGSRERLRIALENLCYNALSFTPPDGVITLSLKGVDQSACIMVRDTGPGIAAEDLPHIFERGFTRRSSLGGEGLGLFIVRAVAQEHGGSVEAESQPGAGCLFRFYVPVLNRQATEMV